jgi:type VI protein secretion system component VasF
MSEKEGSEAMEQDEISRLRERNRELLDLLADAVDMLNIAMMEIHAWHASGSPTEEERQRVTEIESTRNRIRRALRWGQR